MRPVNSERLGVRPIGPSDFLFLHAMWSDPVVTRLWWHGRPLEPEETRQQIDRAARLFAHPATGAWILVDRLDGTDVGMGEIWFNEDGECELGCVVALDHQSKGHATRFVRWATDHAFKHSQAKRLLATAHPENTASIRTLEKCGFRRCGYLPEKTRILFELRRPS